MRPPAFWFGPAHNPGLLARTLSPLGWLYAKATERRLGSPGYKAGVPVICVGNLNVGGTGKTPLAIALIGLLDQRGKKVAIVSRGYGGSLSGPVQVDPAHHTAAEVGDEPLLLAAFAPTFIGHDRAAAVKRAEATQPDVILLDDGFQNPSVQKDLSLVVVDARQGFGNGLCLPAGPLREPVATGLRRADFVVVVGDDAAQQMFRATWPVSVPMLAAKLEPVPTGMDWQGARVLAFAGIGNPQKFFDTLRGLGADLVRKVALDDHQPLSAALIKRLQLEAVARRAQLVTTEKDAVRLPQALQSEVLILVVRLRLQNAAPLTEALQRLGL